MPSDFKDLNFLLIILLTAKTHPSERTKTKQNKGKQKIFEDSYLNSSDSVLFRYCPFVQNLLHPFR
jgi:hypothetical protein